MPRRKIATNTDNLPDYEWSRRITLSCGHAQLKMPPLPELGSTIACGPCQCDVTVTEVDHRELQVYCETHGIVKRFHPLATLTANVSASKHNVTDNKGKCHATVRESGHVDTVNDPATDMRSTLRDERPPHGSLF